MFYFKRTQIKVTVIKLTQNTKWWGWPEKEEEVCLDAATASIIEEFLSWLKVEIRTTLKAASNLLFIDDDLKKVHPIKYFVKVSELFKMFLEKTHSRWFSETKHLVQQGNTHMQNNTSDYSLINSDIFVSHKTKLNLLTWPARRPLGGCQQTLYGKQWHFSVYSFESHHWRGISGWASARHWLSEEIQTLKSVWLQERGTAKW